MIAQKVQDAIADKFRKHDKFTKKTKGTNSTDKETLEVEDDETEVSADGDDDGSNDEGSTVSEGVGDKHTHGRDRKTRHLKNLVCTSNSFVVIRDNQRNVVQAKCCIIRECTGKACVRRLIVVVCCSGSYLLLRLCRQVANHHRHRKMRKQGWRCRTASR